MDAWDVILVLRSSETVHLLLVLVNVPLPPPPPSIAPQSG